MRLLYLVFIASTLALLWAVWAVARTIRSHRREGRRLPGSLNLQRDPDQERGEPHDEQ